VSWFQKDVTKLTWRLHRCLNTVPSSPPTYKRKSGGAACQLVPPPHEEYCWNFSDWDMDAVFKLNLALMGQALSLQVGEM
jgi:hypothetical protein